MATNFDGTQSRTVPTRDMIYAPAVPSPHQGISYNPPVNAYRDLLRSAHQVEERKVVEEEKYGKVKEAMDSARRTIYGSEVPTAEGMIIDVPLEDAEDVVDAENAVNETVEQKGESSVAEKRTRRKTTQQRQKALRVLEEVSKFLLIRVWHLIDLPPATCHKGQNCPKEDTRNLRQNQGSSS